MIYAVWVLSKHLGWLHQACSMVRIQNSWSAILLNTSQSTDWYLTPTFSKRRVANGGNLTRLERFIVHTMSGTSVLTNNCMKYNAWLCSRFHLFIRFKRTWIDHFVSFWFLYRIRNEFIICFIPCMITVVLRYSLNICSQIRTELWK